MKLAAALLLGASLALLAQDLPQFEMTSVKPFDPSPSAGRGVGGCTPFRMDRSRVDICAPLAGVISYAYGIPPDQRRRNDKPSARNAPGFWP
jgi:hypothetical protein